MRTNTVRLCLPVLLVATGASAQDRLSQDETEFFETRIRPVLVEHCYDCHSQGARRIKGDFLLDTREGIRTGGPSGHGIVPGDPDESWVIRAIRYTDEDFEMPPDDRLPDEVIADFEAWVRMGAPDPRGADADASPFGAAKPGDEAWEEMKNFWSFVQPTAPEVPEVQDTAWPWSDVDRFLLAEMEARGLDPVKDAERATLVRRLTFDLTGLPPTPEEIDAFVRDRKNGAIERLVDRLLESSAFGERWGRHWLDVARYAESSGKENNILYPHAWRYRDYVIDAFNDDKPFDQFLREQIAGDLLPSFSDDERAELMTATGFLALGPKSHNSQNTAQFALDLADEQIDALSQGMLGMTLACARCHDHKFDPIPQTEYYALAGIFISTETCYGTPRSQGNRRPSNLLDLPAGAAVPQGRPMEPAIRAVIEQRRDAAQQQADRLAEQVQQMGRERTSERQQAAQRLRRNRDQVSTLTSILDRYKEDGTPSANALVAMGVREAARMRDAPLLVRGEIEKRGDLVPRGFPEALADNTAPIRAGSGRLELADWIASAQNPLTARVWVNRVWLHLFGAPIVPTPDNFGHSGLAPTHPDLLDHLAIGFMDDDGWSTKSLVRRLVLTHAYQLGSWHDSRNHEIDPDNTFRWRMDRRRLEAESIRDAMLAAAGSLDLERPAGSPISVLEGPVQTLDRFRGADLEPPVRSVYLPVLRDRLPESLDVFDFAEPAFVTGDREETNVPSQALFMLNSEMAMSQALAMANRLMEHRGTDVQRVKYAFRLTLGREPSSGELAAVRRFFEDFPEAQADGAPQQNQRRPRGRIRDRLRDRNNPAGANGTNTAAAMRRTGWAAFCQSLFASAEFRYLN